MRQNKVANRVCALDGIWVAVKGVQEPGVLGGDEFARLFISPQLHNELATQYLVNQPQLQARFKVDVHIRYTHSPGASQCSSAEPHATPRGSSRSCRSDE